MSRLALEFQRLYHPVPALPQGAPPVEPATAPSPLLDAQGRTRALVLALAHPAEWEPLAQVWRGVQTDLDWPAPAIAVAGEDGLQLWFSLREPLPADQARAVLEALRLHYLPDLAHRRVRLLPAEDPGGGWLHANAVPVQQPGAGLWSAFVAPDLAPIFAESPWLDLEPGEDGQAKLLAGLASITPQALGAGLQVLQPAAAPVAAPPLLAGPAAASALVPAPPVPHPAGPGAAEAAPTAWAHETPGAARPHGAHPVPGNPADPRQFLQAVMNDQTAPLALRLQAAQALLGAGPG